MKTRNESTEGICQWDSHWCSHFLPRSGLHPGKPWNRFWFSKIIGARENLSALLCPKKNDPGTVFVWEVAAISCSTDTVSVCPLRDNGITTWWFEREDYLTADRFAYISAIFAWISWNSPEINACYQTGASCHQKDISKTYLCVELFPFVGIGKSSVTCCLKASNSQFVDVACVGQIRLISSRNVRY